MWKIALKNLMCKIGIHKWSKPGCIHHASSNVKDCEAYCRRCGKKKTWIEIVK